MYDSPRSIGTKLMSIRTFLPFRAICAIGALGLGLSPVLAQQEPPADLSSPPPRTQKPAKPEKKVAAKPAKTDDVPAIAAPLKQKTAAEKPKLKRPFGELEGWSSSAEAEKKVLPSPRDESSSGYTKPPIGFDNGGHMGMGLGF
jgi:hypothetical protein